MGKYLGRLLLCIASILVFYTLIYQRNVYLSPFLNPNSNPYIYSANLIKEIADIGEGAVYLVQEKNHIYHANPEISRLVGFMGGDGYLYQFLNSLNSKKFKVIGVSEYCMIRSSSGDPENVTIFIAPNAVKKIENNCLTKNLIRLYSGYGLEMNKDALEKFFQKYTQEKILSSDFKSIKIDSEEHLMKEGPEVSYVVRPWGRVNQILVLSKVKSVELRFKNDLPIGSWFTFSHSPAYAARTISNLLSPPPEITFENVQGGIQEGVVGEMFFLNINDAKGKISFNDSNYSKHFNAYVFVMHDPQLHIKEF